MSGERPALSLGPRIALIAFATIAIIAVVPVAALMSGYFHRFHIPSEAMEPTLKVGDAFIAKMGAPDALNRGDIVLVAVGDATYVKRIAALPGDTIGLVDGIVHLNGRPVAQRRIGQDRVSATGPLGDTATRLEEQFPGEARAHQIYDMGYSATDDYPAVRIPHGHVFLLGDNRDNSADSRISRDQMGVGGAVPIAGIRGRPWWYYRLAPRAEGPTPTE